MGQHPGWVNSIGLLWMTGCTVPQKVADGRTALLVWELDSLLGMTDFVQRRLLMGEQHSLLDRASKM